MKRLTGLWAQYNDAGELKLVEFVDGRWVFEIHGIPADWWFCCSVTGWALEAGAATVGKPITGGHPECRSKGGRKCVWEFRWTGS